MDIVGSIKWKDSPTTIGVAAEFVEIMLRLRLPRSALFQTTGRATAAVACSMQRQYVRIFLRIIHSIMVQPCTTESFTDV